MSIKFDPVDVAKFRRLLAKIAIAGPGAAKEFVIEAGSLIRDESKKRAPFLSGALELAHFSRVTRTALDGVTVEIGFDPVLNSRGQDYGVFMHEGLDAAGQPYNLGAYSELKNTDKPHYGKGVGMKFLKRATDFVMRNYEKAMARRVAEKVEEEAREANFNSEGGGSQGYWVT